MIYCCDRLRDEMTVDKRGVGTPAMDHDHECMYVQGCCGGQCYMLSDIIYCPFCGTKYNGTKEET